jgi:hypothetical protein
MRSALARQHALRGARIVALDVGLVLGERRHDVTQQSSLRRLSVDADVQEDERDAVGLEGLEELDEVREAASEAAQLGHDHGRVTMARFDQGAQSRAVAGIGIAREVDVGIDLGERKPSIGAVGGDLLRIEIGGAHVIARLRDAVVAGYGELHGRLLCWVRRPQG